MTDGWIDLDPIQKRLPRRVRHLESITPPLAPDNGLHSSTCLDVRSYFGPISARRSRRRSTSSSPGSIRRGDAPQRTKRPTSGRNAALHNPNAPANAIQHATILTANGQAIQGGTIVLAGGAIASLGADASVSLPSGAKAIDGRGIYGGTAERGTFERGNVADVVVWSGDPLELTSRAETVIIGGVVQSLVIHQSKLLDRYKVLHQ